MNKKMVRNLIISVAVLAILSVAYYFVMKMPEDKPEVTTPDYTPIEYIEVFNRKSDEISEININNEKNSFTAARKEEEYFVKEYTDFLFSKAKLNSLFLDFATINAEQELTEEGDYGFSDPIAVVNITLKDGNSYTFSLGNKISGSSKYFLLNNGKAYVISEYEGANFLKTLNSLRETNIAEIDNQSVSAMKVEKDGKTLVDIRTMEEKEAENFSSITTQVMTYPKYVSVSMDGYGPLLQEIVPVTAVDFPSDNKNYGLGKLKLTITDKDNTHTIIYGDKDEKGNVYAQIEGAKYVFLTSSALFDKLYSLDPQSLMDKFALLVNIDKLNGLEIFGGGKSFNFIINGEGDSAKYFINDKELDETNFKAAYRAVIGLSVNGFREKEIIGQDADYTVIYKYKDGNQDICEYKSYDERNYAVFINSKSEFIILKKKLTAAMEEIEGLVNR